MRLLLLLIMMSGAFASCTPAGETERVEEARSRVHAELGQHFGSPVFLRIIKEDFILEIIRYINRQWELLYEQILSLFEDDPLRRLTEVCVAYVRFWVANPNYRSVLTMSEEPTAVSVDGMIRQYCADKGANADETERTVIAIKALVYGVTTMIERGELENAPKTYEYVRATVEKELA